GKTLFCSGAGDEVIHAFQFRDGQLSEHREFKLRNIKERGVPAGLAVDGVGRQIFAANVWGHRVSRLELLPEPKTTDLLIGTYAATPATVPLDPSTDFETAAANKRAEAQLYNYNPEDTFPYACRLDEKRQRLYVSLWAQAAVAVMDLRSGQTIARWPAEDHPSEMALARSGR